MHRAGPDPDLRRRHERGAARHRGRGRARAAPPAAEEAGGADGLHPEREPAGTRRAEPAHPRRPRHAAAAARGGGGRGPVRPQALGRPGRRPGSWPRRCRNRWAGPGSACWSSARCWTRSGAPWRRSPYLASIVLGAGALARFGTPDQQRAGRARGPRRAHPHRRAGRGGRRRPPCPGGPGRAGGRTLAADRHQDRGARGARGPTCSWCPRRPPRASRCSWSSPAILAWRRRRSTWSTATRPGAWS